MEVLSSVVAGFVIGDSEIVTVMLLQEVVGGCLISIHAYFNRSCLGVGGKLQQGDQRSRTVYDFPHCCQYPFTDFSSHIVKMTAQQHPAPPSNSSSVTLNEPTADHSTGPKKLDDTGKPSDLEANTPDPSVEVPTHTDKAPLSTIRKHVLLALFATVCPNLNAEVLLTNRQPLSISATSPGREWQSHPSLTISTYPPLRAYGY